MTVKEFLNGFLGEYNYIIFNEYVGDPRAIGADLEEDYKTRFICKFGSGNIIPEHLRKRKIEYFDFTEGNIVLFLE